MRYYYTDPIAAAWMAKQFGMKIKCVTLGNMQNWSDAEDTIRHGLFVHPELADVEGEKYYIHPDSLHLLEPKKGDWIHLDGLMYYAKAIEENGEEAGRAIVPYGDEVAWLNPRAQTVRRNDRPFFWPEQEPS